MINVRKFINRKYFYIPLLIMLGICFYYKVLAKTSDAFRGAFFGFIVGILTFLFSKYMEIRSKRYNALVYIEQELNAAINDLHGNKFQIDKILNSDNLTLLFPCEAKLSEEYIKNLGRAELKNDIFSLYIDFKKYNHSIKMAIEIYERNIAGFRDFESQRFGRSADVLTIIKSYHQYFKTQLKEIDEFGDKVIECLKTCLVKIRFFVKIDKTLLASNIGLPYYDKKEFEKWLIEDRIRLESESKETAKKDLEERKKK